MATFVILILPIHELGRSFYLLRSISFFRDLKFLSYRTFTCLVRDTPRYVILFVTIVKGVISLISFSVYDFKSESYFSGMFAYPGLAAVGELGSDDAT